MRIFIALFIASSAAALAQPSIAVTPASIDFGAVGPRRVDTTIVLANRGKEPLVVERLATSCGCTAAPFAQRTLVPGDTAHVAVSIDARHKNGDVRTSVTVISNDARTPSLVVPLHASVSRAVAAPEFLGPDRSAVVGRPHELSLQIRNTSTKPLRLSEARISGVDGIEASVEMGEVVLEAGEGRNIPVKVTALKTGAGSGTLTITTDSPSQPQLSIGLHTFAAGDAQSMESSGR